MEKHKVIIIGGGISGLATAQLLAQNNVDYVILEGRNRIGGRIQTCRDGLAPYDLGASWAHDTLTNPLFDEILEDEEKFREDKYGLYYDDENPLYFGSKMGPKYFAHHKIEQVVKELEKFIELTYFEEIEKKDISLHDIILQYIKKQGKLLTEEQVMYAPQLARHLELWHGIGWNEMSSKFGLVDNVGRNCLFRKGYDTVIESIATSLDSSRILKNSIVKTINSNSSSIEIELTNGKRYITDWLVCTVPQSILQLDSKEMGGIEWVPTLPTRIKDSLDNMSWGKLGKIVFEFETAWWSHFDTDRYVALADPQPAFIDFWNSVKENKTKNYVPINTKNDDKLLHPWDFPVLILNLHKIDGVPALLCFTQGVLTEYLEQNPDKAWDYMGPILTKLSSNDLDNLDDQMTLKIKPTRVITSQWTVDPFSRGSYAACKPNNDPTDLVIQLSRGLNNIRFAGEHTILDGAGAVHGAWMSGRREANHILIKEGIIEGKIEEW